MDRVTSPRKKSLFLARLRPGLFFALLTLAASVPMVLAAGAPAPRSAPSIALQAADPTGQRDSAPAIQAALDALPDHGGTVDLGPGDFRIDTPIRLRPGTIWRRNMRLRGAGAVGADSISTTLWWHGDPNVAPVQITGAHNTVEGLRVVPYGTNTMFVGIDIDWDAASGMECTRNVVAHCCVQGPMTYGIRLAATAPANGDDCTFEDVAIGGFLRSGLYLASRNMQSKCENVTRCRFESGGANGQDAVYCESGSVRLRNCWFSGVDQILNVQINTDYQVLEDCQAEGFQSIAVCGGASTGMPVTIRGGRFGFSQAITRPQVILRGGPLVMEGVKFEGNYAGDALEFDCEGGYCPTSILADGCYFPTDRPHFSCDSDGMISVRGCKGMKADGSEMLIRDWKRAGGATTVVGKIPSLITSTPGDYEDPSALLNLVSPNQGFLPPRMSTVQRLSIVAPAEGLVVFDTDLHTLCVHSGGGWLALGGTPVH